MEAREFAAAYPVDLREKQIHRGAHAPYIHEAQDYSYQWGRLLHSVLGSEVEGPLWGPKDVDDYYEWLCHGLPAMTRTIYQQKPEIASHALNEVNFHYLNQRLLWLWEPLVRGWKSEQARRQTISDAQRALAFDGFKYYCDREAFVEHHGGTHSLFEPENKQMHQAYTGMIQEYDAGIVLLDVMRKYKQLIIVPAPLQFERSYHQINVDFVAVDQIDGRAIGIQVRSRVLQESIDKADTQRVVFLDGDIDLNNVKLVRIDRARSLERPVAWPGVIAAKRIDMIKGYGHDVRYIPDARVIANHKMRARHLVGKLKVDHRELAERIGSRIMQRI